MRNSDCLRTTACLVGAAALISGCELSSTSTEPPPIPTARSLDAPPEVEPKAPGKTADVQERNFNGAVFQVPAAWDESPNQGSGFIIAEFQIPGADGPARLTLSTAGGDVAANVERWRGQFRRSPDDPSPRESTLKVDGREATLVELFGTYQDMMSKQAQPASAMLGVVIPLKATNYFVKATGPRGTVTDARDTFLKFVESAKFNE